MIIIDFYDEDRKLIGHDEMGMPPGTAYTRIGQAVPTTPRGQEMPQYFLTDEEAAEIWLLSEEREEQAWLAQHHRGRQVEPAEHEPVFGGDGREVVHGSDLLFPLASRCWCGHQIGRGEGETRWRHSD